MSDSAIYGAAFAASGMGILTTQIIVMDVARFFIRLSKEVEDCFGHDTKLFNDYNQP